jgi:hypothetical protein
MLPLYHDGRYANLASERGNLRTFMPQAEKMALQTAGATRTLFASPLRPSSYWN